VVEAAGSGSCAALYLSSERTGIGDVLDGRPGGGRELGGTVVMEAKRGKVESGVHPLKPRKAVDALSCSKNFQFLHEASLEYCKQLSQFCRLQIPNRNNIKNLGTDSIFESLMNF
jgi:hypothetical protein